MKQVEQYNKQAMENNELEGINENEDDFNVDNAQVINPALRVKSIEYIKAPRELGGNMLSSPFNRPLSSRVLFRPRTANVNPSQMPHMINPRTTRPITALHSKPVQNNIININLNFFNVGEDKKVGLQKTLVYINEKLVGINKDMNQPKSMKFQDYINKTTTEDFVFKRILRSFSKEHKKFTIKDFA